MSFRECIDNAEKEGPKKGGVTKEQAEIARTYLMIQKSNIQGE